MATSGRLEGSHAGPLSFQPLRTARPRDYPYYFAVLSILSSLFSRYAPLGVFCCSASTHLCFFVWSTFCYICVFSFGHLFNTFVYFRLVKFECDTEPLRPSGVNVAVKIGGIPPSTAGPYQTIEQQPQIISRPKNNGLRRLRFPEGA